VVLKGRGRGHPFKSLPTVAPKTVSNGYVVKTAQYWCFLVTIVFSLAFSGADIEFDCNNKFYYSTFYATATARYIFNDQRIQITVNI